MLVARLMIIVLTYVIFSKCFSTFIAYNSDLININRNMEYNYKSFLYQTLMMIIIFWRRGRSFFFFFNKTLKDQFHFWRLFLYLVGIYLEFGLSSLIEFSMFEWKHSSFVLFDLFTNILYQLSSNCCRTFFTIQTICFNIESSDCSLPLKRDKVTQ